MSGIDGLFRGMRAAATGLASERVRIDVIAENIANARVTSTPEGGPYRRKLVVFEPVLQEVAAGQRETIGVRVARVIPDLQTPTERISDPGHPDADSEGMVEYPNVNTIQEMADLITAMRSYESNLSVKETFQRMAERALELARS